MWGPFKRMPGSLAAVSVTRMDGIPIDFHSQGLWGLFFLTLASEAGTPYSSEGDFCS